MSHCECHDRKYYVYTTYAFISLLKRMPQVRAVSFFWFAYVHTQYKVEQSTLTSILLVFYFNETTQIPENIHRNFCGKNLCKTTTICVFGSPTAKRFPNLIWCFIYIFFRIWRTTINWAGKQVGGNISSYF